MKIPGFSQNDTAPRRLQKIVTVVLLIGDIAYIAMMVYCCRYIHFYMDDFSYMNENLAQLETGTIPGYLSIAFKLALDKYLYWQGVWFSNILNYLLYGLQVFGIWAFQILAAAVVLGVYSGLVLLVREIVTRFHTDAPLFWTALLLTSFIAAGMSTTSPGEVYYWIDVVMAYSIPFACGIYGIAFYLKYDRTGRNWCRNLAMILGALACGATLTNTAMFTAIYMGIFLYRCAVGGKIKWGFGLPFYCTFFGALANAMAPGNYVRRGNHISTSFDIPQTLRLSFEVAACRYQELFHSFLIGVSLLLAAFVLTEGKEFLCTKLHPIWTWLYAFFTMMLMPFPYVLGYDGATDVADRNTYGMDLAAAIMFVMCVIYTVCWLRQKVSLPELSVKVRTLVVLLGCAALLVNVGAVGLKSSRVVRQASELANGMLDDYYEKLCFIYDGIRDAEEEDVTITVVDFPYTEIMPWLSLSEDPTNWVNISAAKHYGKASVSVYREYTPVE